jgi:hypothetical protein
VNQGVTLFCYPEELRYVEPDRLAEQVGELANSVSVALVYHRARRIFPRHRAVSTLSTTVAYFEPERSRYGVVTPASLADPELRRLVLRFREACARRDVRFRAWVVALHDEHLAAEHPSLASRLLDGSSAEHGLCPSNVETIEFAAGLAGDVAAQLGPEAIDLEAAWYPAWEPSYSLTLALEPLSEQALLLGTQCFCDSCRSLFGSAAAELEQQARRAAGPPFAGASANEEHAALLHELAAGRALGATRLIAAVAAAVRKEGARLRLFVSGPPQRVRLQGVSAEAIAAADEVLYGCGPLAGADLLDRYGGLAEAAGRGGSVSMNWSPSRPPATLAEDVRGVVAAGAEGLALYNLSLVPEAGLDAFRAATRAYRATLRG